MIAKKYRLPVQDVFKRRGRTIRSPLFTLNMFPAAHPWSQFGVALGRGTAKGAVIRNRTKRAVFNCISRERTRLPLADYLIIPSPAASHATREELARELIHLFSLVANH